MRGFITQASSSVINFVLDVRDAIAETVRSHFDFFHDGWKPQGVFLRLPFTRISIWLERPEQSVGWGHEANGPTDREFYLGRLRGVLSVAR